ncbi:MAG: hypothetical protein SOU84_02720 [Candidatus Faecimonas sp.]|nr:hypothetical protein [Mycoplasmatota bacterium]MDY2908052.1 hypothetical protein [Candidatus Faecimonas sp.]
MDDVYEFENSEYRLASMQIKAIAYDVMTGITRKKGVLKNKDIPTEVLNRLTLISDRIVELTDSLEEELQKLDQTIENTNEKQLETTLNNMNQSTIEVKETPEELPKPEAIIQKEFKEENNITPLQQPKVEMNNVQENEPVEEPQKIDKSITTSKSGLTENQESEISHSPEMNEVEETDSPMNATTVQEPIKEFAKKRLQKTTKSLSKAIMVRPNQLQNLRKSRRFQEQLLAKQGVFEKADQAEEIIPITQGSQQLPDEIERQIEDLTVKANIYYNEGEVDKAQELYDKIRKLNEQYR